MIRDVLVTPPTVEPVSVSELKTHCRIDTSTSGDTAYLTGLIKAARSMTETLTNQVFITQTWKLYRPDFPATIELIRNPVQSITSIKYVDMDGVQQTLDPSKYELDAESIPAGIIPAYAEVWPIVSPENWPSARNTLKAVEVVYVAGYGDKSANVPDDIKHAIKLLAGFYYENREAAAAGTVNEIPLGIKFLLSPYRVTGW